MVKTQENSFSKNGLKKVVKFIIIPFLALGMFLFFFIKMSYIVNISASIPVGIYKTYEIDREIKVGDIVTFLPNENLNEYFKKRKIKETFIKHYIKIVVGVEGDSFKYKYSQKSGSYYILKNDKYNLGTVYQKDSKGNKLPRFGECTLQKDEYYVMGSHNKSFDSRYLGKISRKNIKKFAKPVFTF